MGCDGIAQYIVLAYKYSLYVCINAGNSPLELLLADTERIVAFFQTVYCSVIQYKTMEDSKWIVRVPQIMSLCLFSRFIRTY